MLRLHPILIMNQLPLPVPHHHRRSSGLARRKGGTFLAKLLRSLRRFRPGTTPSSSSQPEKRIDERIIIQADTLILPSSSHNLHQHSTSRHVRQHSRIWDDLRTDDKVRTESDDFQSVVSSAPTQNDLDQSSQLLSPIDNPDESSASISQPTFDDGKIAAQISVGEHSQHMMCLMSPPRVKRISCILDSNIGRGRERFANAIERVSSRLSSPVKAREFDCASCNIVPHEYSGSPDLSRGKDDYYNEDTLSLEYSSSLEYSDDESIDQYAQ